LPTLELAELGADPGRVRMVQLIQDCEWVCPGGPGLPEIPGHGLSATLTTRR